MESLSDLPLASDGFITNEKPIEHWKRCTEAQSQWCGELSDNDQVVREMALFSKQKTISFIWESNQLEGTLPDKLTQNEVEKKLLEELIDQSSYSERTCTQSINSTHSSAIQQLVNHLHAYRILCNEDVMHSCLTEDLIKDVHKTMMQDLNTDDGEKVNAGIYRSISVHAGRHVFPSHECVPSSMIKIVADYESKASTIHDPYQLASWLFCKVVSLHPFEDGNGRLSRILWCYSLMRDGLPFPPVLTSGHRRSQKHLVMCLERDRRLSVIGHPHLTTLTVVSVDRLWKSFLSTSGVLNKAPLKVE